MLFSSPLRSARFVRRHNRFMAQVELEGCLEQVHVPNTGRLQELFLPGATVYLSAAAKPGRKTSWDLTLVDKDGLLCAVDTRIPQRLLRERELLRLLGLTEPWAVKVEAKRDKHRLDLWAKDPQGQVWVEAKTVTLVSGKTALFPDAPTERGASHMRALTQIAKGGERAIAAFMVLRQDADEVRPHGERDPLFAEALKAAEDARVTLQAFRYRVDLDGVFLDKEIPVRF